MEPGVAGVSDPPRVEAMSEFSRSRLRPRRSPKLLRPVEKEVLETGGARCSSTDWRGEFIPRELIVEDLPLLCIWLRVGEEWPECLEFGRKRAVAGDALDLANRVAAWFCGGGVVTPFLEGALDVVGVDCAGREPMAGDRSGEAGTDTTSDEPETLGSSVKEVLLFGWR